MDDSASTIPSRSSSQSTNEPLDLRTIDETILRMASHLQADKIDKQVQTDDTSKTMSMSSNWKCLNTILVVIIFHIYIIIYLSLNLVATEYHWLICLAVIFITLVVPLNRHYIQNNEKQTKSTQTQVTTEPNSDPKNQQIVDALMDLLQRLLNEPVPLSQVKERKGIIFYMWLALKDVQHSSSLPHQTELKLMELAQITVEQFADDINILKLAITVLHNGISLKREMFQNATDRFLKNLLNFCEVHESVYKWKCIEILLCYLHVCNDVMTDSSLWYQHVVLKLKDILQKADIDGEANHVTLSRFKLYYTWLNDSNIDVVRQYAEFAICRLLCTESNMHIIELLDVDKLLKLMNERKQNELKSRQRLQYVLNKQKFEQNLSFNN